MVHSHCEGSHCQTELDSVSVAVESLPRPGFQVEQPTDPNTGPDQEEKNRFRFCEHF